MSLIVLPLGSRRRRLLLLAIFFLGTHTILISLNLGGRLRILIANKKLFDTLRDSRGTDILTVSEALPCKSQTFLVHAANRSVS